MNDKSTKIATEILRLRLSQMAINDGIKNGQFKVPIHLALGHEALAVAVNAVMGEGDKLILSHRNLAYHLARQSSLKEIWNEYRLNPSGLNAGKSGSMNLINVRRGIVYTSSILGNNFPVSTGVAMAEQMSRTKSLTIVLGGDGSIEEGAFYESLVLAKTLGLGIIFIIENNDWSLATRVKERRCQIDLGLLTKSVKIKYVKLSGNNPDKYITQLKQLRSYALSKQSPVCVEAEVATLGDWRGPATPQHPNGKFINYHANASPSVSFNQSPIIKQNASDPVFVVKKYFQPGVIEKIRQHILKELN